VNLEKKKKEPIKTLIIDDNEDIRILVQEFLKNDPSYNCIQARDGLEALEMIQKESIDLVLLDIMMPKLNGVEVLKRIRAHDEQLKVIMFTSINKKEVVLDCYEGLANDYLLKPISKEALIDKLELISHNHKEEI
jgi:CheY-like chemotaxis protein